jgi:ComF family protein
MIGVVNSTRFGGLVDWLCPHYCCLCGRLGGILCECCKKYMIWNTENVCVACGEPTEDGHCDLCRLPFGRLWMVGYRDEPVGAVAELYKFESVRVLGRELAGVLASRLPDLGEVIVVPVPTVRRHVRERGVDHARMIARWLARLRGWRVDAGLVRRQRETVQTGVGRRERVRQAGQAFVLAKIPDPQTHYLVVDDIWTTGASIKAVCQLLRAAGAQRIDAAVLARSR